MTTSMYFSTNEIVVLQGKINKELLQVQKVFTEPLEKGSLINGVITNDAAVCRSMENLLQKVKLQKEVIDLVVDSGSVLTKRLDVPFLPTKKLSEIAKNEFLEVLGNYEDLIYDFGVICPKNPTGEGGSILCAAMESTLAFSYIHLFKRFKLRLHSIDLAISSQIAMVQYLPEFMDKTFVLMILDGNMLTATLYVKGQFLFSNRTRLLNLDNLEEVLDEIGQTVSSLRQFNQAQKTGEDISAVYLCGISQEEEATYKTLSDRLFLPVSSVLNSPAVQVGAEVANFRLADYFYATGNLLIKDGAYHG